MNEILGFVNKKTKILLILNDNNIEIDGRNVCPLNQQEIARLMSCGKLKVNQIIKDLIANNYVEMVHAKGRYMLTNRGKEILKKLSLG